MKLVISIFLFLLIFLLESTKTFAVVDPLSVSNNKFGVHIASPTFDEASSAAQLVNSNGGDWGYVTVVIQANDRDFGKWQTFFDNLRKLHLVPIVRIAGVPVKDYWEKPEENDAQKWADFLDKLNWPTKNRYVVIYNEPNHAREWGNIVDPVSYAQILDKTISQLKEKSSDFFVLNAGLDASAPHKPPNFYDEVRFLFEMQNTVPGIFEKLDGWVSHSYPNPDFVGLPTDFGRGTVRTFIWEQAILKNLGVQKSLPIFITETGWKHSEGLDFKSFLPSPETVGQYLKTAYNIAWTNPQIVAVTPFILSYQGEPFDHFSFKKLDGKKQTQEQVLGLQFPDFHKHFEAVAKMTKPKGQPIQINRAKLVKGEIYKTIVSGETYTIPLTFKNTGQSIWETGRVKLVATKGELTIKETSVTKSVEPEKEYTFEVNITAPKSGTFDTALNLINIDREFDSPSLEFATEVKPPVILRFKSKLLWKNDYMGEYKLKVTNHNIEQTSIVQLDKNGESVEQEHRYLLPGYTFNFTLLRPFYSSKTIKQTVYSGVNVLDFKTLNPDIAQLIFNPKELWKILPLSNK